MSNTEATAQELELKQPERIDNQAPSTNDALDKMTTQINEIRTTQSNPKESLVASAAASDLPVLSIHQEKELVALTKPAPGEAMKQAEKMVKLEPGEAMKLGEKMVKLEPLEAMKLGEKMVKLEPLSRTENLLLKGLQSEINKGSLEGTQEMLRAIAENPASAARVLNEFKLNTQAANDLRNVDYIIGKDANGQPFIQLSITQSDSSSKSSPYTTVSLDNRGNASATRCASIFKPPFSVEAGPALQGIYAPRWREKR